MDDGALFLSLCTSVIHIRKSSVSVMQAGGCVTCSNSLTTQLEESGDWRKREIGTER